MDTLREFIKFRIPYEKRARARMPERFDAGLADGQFSEWVVEEMLMDMHSRIGALEQQVKSLKDLLNPTE